MPQPDKPSVGLIGLGNLGTAIANLVTTNCCAVIGWEYDAAVVDEINSQHTNQRFLPGISLDHSLRATTDVSQVFGGTEIVFLAIPARFIRPTVQAVVDAGLVSPDTVIVNMACKVLFS